MRMRGGRGDHQHSPDSSVDHYRVLGVGPAAGVAEVRRAFRVLALQHHPDRAGPGSTELFQRISAAYAILSDPAARARYDERIGVRNGRAAPPPVSNGSPNEQAGEYEGPGGRIGWRRRQARNETLGPFLARISGHLDALLARGFARRADDGAIDLLILPAEAEGGGHVTIDAEVAVVCPTCAGIAAPHVLWCRRCEHAGAVIDQVTFTLQLPPHARDGLTFTFATDPRAEKPLRVRLRVSSSIAPASR